MSSGGAGISSHDPGVAWEQQQVVDFYKYLSPEGKAAVDAQRAAQALVDPPPPDDDDLPAELCASHGRSAPASALPSPSPHDGRAAARAHRADREEQERQLELRQQEDLDAASPRVTLEGTITRVKFSGEDFFAIAELRRKDREDPIVVKGALAGLSEWCDVRLQGRWTTNPRYGQQFEFESGEILLPSDTKGAERFLALHLPSIGPGRAHKIVAQYGSGPDGLAGLWALLDQHPEQLTAIPGITDADIPEIRKEYAASRGLRDQEVWLRNLEVGPKRTLKILARYRESTRAILEADPYVVMDLKGFGFVLADDLAHRIGVSNDHPGRARAALLHVLQEAAEGEGHCYLPQADLLARTDELSVPAERVLELITWLAGREGGQRLVVVADPTTVDGAGPQRKVALAGLADAEKRVAEQILGRLQLARGERSTAPMLSAAVVCAASSAVTASSSPSPSRGPELDREIGQKQKAKLGARAWKKRAGSADTAAVLAKLVGEEPPATTLAQSSAASGGASSLGMLDASVLAAALRGRP